MLVDFAWQVRLAASMASDPDQIEQMEVRRGLFAIITARFEKAHEAAVMGQAHDASAADISAQLASIQTILDETKILVAAISLLNASDT